MVHKGRVWGNSPSVGPGWVRGCPASLWQRDQVPEPEAGGGGGVVALQGTPTPVQRLATSATSATTHRQPPQPLAPLVHRRCTPGAPAHCRSYPPPCNDSPPVQRCNDSPAAASTPCA